MARYQRDASPSNDDVTMRCPVCHNYVAKSVVSEHLNEGCPDE